MEINKIIYGDRVLIDLSPITVTEETLGKGIVGINAKGELIVGTASFTKRIQHSITLPLNGWLDNTQTILADEVTSDCTIFAGADIGSAQEYADCEVWCSAQGDGWITFSCTYVPNEDLVVNVAIFI